MKGLDRTERAALEFVRSIDGRIEISTREGLIVASFGRALFEALERRGLMTITIYPASYCPACGGEHPTATMVVTPMDHLLLAVAPTEPS